MRGCRLVAVSKVVYVPLVRGYRVLGQQAPGVSWEEAKEHTSPLEEGAGHWKIVTGEGGG